MTSTELEVVNAEIVDAPPLSEGQARVLNKRIQQACIRVNDTAATLLDLLEEAVKGQIHIALGYPSLGAYFKENVNISPTDANERKTMVSLASGKGMSQRDLAAMFGVNQATISRTLAEMPPDADASPVTIGSDGKTYKREPKQKPKKQEPIDAEWEEEPEEEPPPRTAVDVIEDFAVEVDNLGITMQAFKDILKLDADFIPKARKRLAQRFVNRLQSAIGDLNVVVDELMS